MSADRRRLDCAEVYFAERKIFMTAVANELRESLQQQTATRRCAQGHQPLDVRSANSSDTLTESAARLFSTTRVN
jgi:hypothetical protein